MTEAEEADVLQFAGGTEGRDKTNDRVLFRLAAADADGEVIEAPFVYTAVRPKMAILLRLAAAMDDDASPMKQAAAFDDLLPRILDEKSFAELDRRLCDPEDDMDLDSPGIQNMFETLVGLWYGGRPTVGRPASRGSSARTGRRSTVRSRSAG